MDAVAASIREFGFRQPIVVDEKGVIVVGHTRYKAAITLGLEKVPVHVARGLTPEQIKAYRIADNKTADLAAWDLDLARHPQKSKPTNRKLRAKDRPVASLFSPAEFSQCQKKDTERSFQSPMNWRASRSIHGAKGGVSKLSALWKASRAPFRFRPEASDLPR